MPRITIVLTDTDAGGIAVWSDDVPALGAATSRAQAVAMDIVNRTCREYCLASPYAAISPALRDGVDIDAVHRTRDRVVNVPESRRDRKLGGAL